MKKIYLLIEFGGSYDDAWEEIKIVSFDKKWLEELAEVQNEKSEKSRYSYAIPNMAIREFDISDKETYSEV